MTIVFRLHQQFGLGETWRSSFIGRNKVQSTGSSLLDRNHTGQTNHPKMRKWWVERCEKHPCFGVCTLRSSTQTRLVIFSAKIFNTHHRSYRGYEPNGPNSSDEGWTAWQIVLTIYHERHLPFAYGLCVRSDCSTREAMIKSSRGGHVQSVLGYMSMLKLGMYRKLSFARLTTPASRAIAD